MTDTTPADQAAQVLAGFEAQGAVRVEPGYLQPADVLLDLYGEDIRARAYRTSDPVLGEQMLRPDFTVPVVRAHIASGRTEARYTYAGPVWRRQEYGSDRANEFWQVGFELIGGQDRAEADAAVFAAITAAISGQDAQATTGDLALLFAAIESLDTSAARKSALRRHVWRPRRFGRLLDRYSGKMPFECDTRDTPQTKGAVIGLRRTEDIDAREAWLQAEKNQPPISVEEVAMIDTILNLRGSMSAALRGLEVLTQVFGGLKTATDAFAARTDAMQDRGLDPDTLAFDGAFGRGSMEYYDGFTFAFTNSAGQTIATGGRYDALTTVLGDGKTVPAVGAVIRPDVLT